MTIFTGRKDFEINRNGRKYSSGDNGTLIATTDEERKLFMAYGFVENVPTKMGVEEVVEQVVEQVEVVKKKTTYPITNNK